MEADGGPVGRRAENAALASAAVFFLAGLAWVARDAGWPAVRWTRYPTFLPLGLILLAAVNHRLRSRFLAWGIFTLAFILLVVLSGAWAVQFRALPAVRGILFLRGFLMYAALALTALFQLRPPRPASSPA